MPSSTEILVTSVKMNIFHVNSRMAPLCFSHGGREWITQRAEWLVVDIDFNDKCVSKSNTLNVISVAIDW